MQIDRQLIDYLTTLSQLRLNEEEKQRAAEDLSKIVQYMNKLNEMDTADVEPMLHVFPMKNVFREDVCQPPGDRDALLANAPHQKDGYFKVPRTLE